MQVNMTLEEYRKLVGGEKNPNAVAGGHKAKRHGDAFQAWLNLYHEHLMTTGKVARVFVQQPPMESHWFHGRLVWTVQAGQKGPCDYGFILASGVSGIFDAKSHAEMERFTWSNDQEHQLTEMRTIHNATGGRSPAFALVQWSSWGEVRIHPIWTIKDRRVDRVDGTLINECYWLDGLRYFWEDVVR